MALKSRKSSFKSEIAQAERLVDVARNYELAVRSADHAASIAATEFAAFRAPTQSVE